MVEDDDDAMPAKVAAMWTPKSSATLDMHYLIVYSRLRGKRDDKAAEQVADAMLGLDPKLEGQAQRNKQNWNARLVEILPHLIEKDPHLTDALLHHKNFVRRRSRRPDGRASMRRIGARRPGSFWPPSRRTTISPGRGRSLICSVCCRRRKCGRCSALNGPISACATPFSFA